MCRTLLIILLICSLFTISCTKSETSSGASLADAVNFRGKFVKRGQRADTLEVSVSNNTNILFNNTQAYRDNQFSQEHPELQIFEYEFVNGKIGTRLYMQISTFVYYQFEWLEADRVFKMQANAIEPNINTNDLFYIYERVQ